jgi:adenylate cyclase
MSENGLSHEIKRQMSENQQKIDQLNDQLSRKTDEIKIIQTISSEILNTLDLETLFDNIMSLMHEVFGFEHCMILLSEDTQLRVASSHGHEDQGIGMTVPMGKGVIGTVAQRRKIMRMMGLRTRRRYVQRTAGAEADALPTLKDADSQIAIPLQVKDKLVGVYTVESEKANAFDALDEEILTIVSNQVAAAIDNASAYNQLQKLAEANSRFVPRQFLRLLGKEAITETELDDQIEESMTVLFSDIRDFTPLSESMSPAETFAFVNDYLGTMAPIIREHGGFIDKYIGDAIMAIFPNSPGDAVAAGLKMEQHLAQFNARIAEQGRPPIRIGIGIHTGPLVAGIVGFAERLEGTVIGDCVNTASRLEGVTKDLSVTLLVSETVVRELAEANEYVFDSLDEVSVKGKAQKVQVFGVSERP